VTDKTLLLRQVHPNFIQNGEVASIAFKPNDNDKGCLSVYDGDLSAPGKLGKGGSHKRKPFDETPRGIDPRPAEPGQRPEASLAWCRGDPGCEA